VGEPITDYLEGAMQKQRRFITLWLMLLAVSLGALAQEKVLLQYKAPRRADDALPPVGNS
jgi:hypothetical protein